MLGTFALCEHEQSSFSPANCANAEQVTWIDLTIFSHSGRIRKHASLKRTRGFKPRRTYSGRHCHARYLTIVIVGRLRQAATAFAYDLELRDAYFVEQDDPN
jgi:hypothetical protein